MAEDNVPSPTSIFIFAGIINISIISGLCYLLFPNYYLILLFIISVIITGVVIAKIVGS